MSIHSSFSHNNPKLEMTQVSFSGWIVKPTLVNPYHEVVLKNKNKHKHTTDIPTNLDEFVDNYAEWKKPITKRCIL